MNEEKSAFLASIQEAIACFHSFLPLCDKQDKRLNIDRIELRKENDVRTREEHSSMIDPIRNDGRLALFLSLACGFDHFFRFYHEQEAMEIDAIYLSSLKPWVVSSDLLPFVRNPYFSVLKYLSWPCPNHCRCCLHENDFPNTRSHLPYKVSDEEIDTRLHYYEPSQSRALPSQQEYHFHEYVNHPRFFEIAKKIREKTQDTIDIITSGIPLQESWLKEFHELKPVMVYISLNCVSPSYRIQTMKDPHPEHTLNMVQKLQEHDLPFLISIVPDEDLPEEELEKTIQFASACGAAVIRVNLPGYSRFHPRYRPGFDYQSFFSRITGLVQNLRSSVKAIMLVQPVYWNDRAQDTFNKSYILGVLPGSPAQILGLKHGDFLLEIQGTSVYQSSFLARKLLRLYQKTRASFCIKVQRGCQEIMFDMDSSLNPGYPYTQLNPDHYYSYPFGIYISEGVSPATLREIMQKIAEYPEKSKILLLCSSLMNPLLVNLLAGFPHLYFEVPEHQYWGGNITCGDLYVAEDYRLTIEKWEQKHGKPDLVLLPASPFGAWGIDLKGQSAKKVLAKYNVYFIKNNLIPSMG